MGRPKTCVASSEVTSSIYPLLVILNKRLLRIVVQSGFPTNLTSGGTAVNWQYAKKARMEGRNIIPRMGLLRMRIYPLESATAQILGRLLTRSTYRFQ